MPVSPKLFASVISTGAPPVSCPIKKSLARSGEIPSRYPLRFRFREFFPRSSPPPSALTKSKERGGQCVGRTPCVSMVRNAASGSLHSAPYILAGTRSQRRSGRDDRSLRGFRKAWETRRKLDLKQSSRSLAGQECEWHTCVGERVRNLKLKSQIKCVPFQTKFPNRVFPQLVKPPPFKAYLREGF